MEIPFEATEQVFGNIETDRHVYRVLDTVTVFISGKASGSNQCIVRVCDPDQVCYVEKQVQLKNNFASISFTAGGKLGNHYVYLIWKDEKRPYARYVNFYLDCSNTIESGNHDVDFIVPFTTNSVIRARREYFTSRGKFVGYISADTWHFDGIWLRDWIYTLPAYKLWEKEMTCGLDRFIENQAENGMMLDGIEKDGRTWRVGLESDVEYIFTIAVWQTWKATGDDIWMEKCLPAIDKALSYIKSSDKHWDNTYNLVKRQHSCDTWDFDIDGAGDKGSSRFVIANCDQSGYFFAFNAISEMYRYLGKQDKADMWRHFADEYRQRAINLLWDGQKFLHHVHIDDIDHNGFDESKQLSMGNTWAMTRKLADSEQSRKIISEYQKRHRETGDAYPWWSLQPGYPDQLGYFKSRIFLRQGGYANGGLMAWVGGELCRAAFMYGYETYGVELLKQYAQHLKKTGGVHVWYWGDGTPGFRTTNEVNYAGWGMAQWIEALFEGLAGIYDEQGLLKKVTVSPRWTAASIKDVYVSMRYGCSQAYVAYRMSVNQRKKIINLLCSGSGDEFSFRVLIPEKWHIKEVQINNAKCDFSTEKVFQSQYVCFSVKNTNFFTCCLDFD